MLSAVQDGPVDLSRVSLQKVGTMAASIQEPEGLSIRLDEGPAPAGVDFVATV